MPGPDIFISYNREDQAVAQHFAEAFEAAGLSVWWDVTLRSGEAYDAVTEQALRAAKAVVVLWSPRSVVSRWVRAEATLADRNRTLIPARIEDCELPIMFELTQTADLSHWRGEAGDRIWQGFLGDVQRMAGKQAEPERHHPGPASPQPARCRKPSIAVLPSINRSGIGEDDDFADGMVEDLTVALTVSRRMKVIASSATAAYRSVARDLRQIGRELGVRYLLEGNVRRVGNDLRVTAQLVEAEDGDILWTQIFDRPLSELAELQEELVTEVAAHLGVQVDRAEMDQALRKPDDISAWEAVLRALSYLGQPTTSNIAHAIAEARRATEIDPAYDLGHATLATALGLKYRIFGADDPDILGEVARSIARAQASVSNDPLVLARIADALNFVDKPEDSYHFAKRAVSLNPNLEIPRISLGTALHLLGRWEEAIAEFDATDKLAPSGPWTAPTLFFRAMSHFYAGRPATGLEFAERALVFIDTNPLQIIKALCLAETGAFASARDSLRRLKSIRPEVGRDLAESLVRNPVCRGMTPEALQQRVDLIRRLWDAVEGEG